MYLQALTLGCAVPHGPFTASIHSVFHSALNLRLKGKGELLTLLASTEPDLPQGIRLATPADFSFKSFEPGTDVVCRDDFLHLGSLIIALHTARRWQSDLTSLRLDLTDPAVSAAWQSVWQALNQRQVQLRADIVAQELFKPSRSLSVTASRASAAIRSLFAATRRLDSSTAGLIEPLIGLGSGLTPAADDLLVGYLAGLWSAAGDQNDRLQFISHLGSEIQRLSHRTNDISRTYLLHASRGQVSSALTDLARGICHAENPERLPRLAAKAMHLGHTSGMDVVTGLLLGLVVWCRPLSLKLTKVPIEKHR